MRSEIVGEILRKRREELGLGLEEVSRRTRIKYDYLKALEEGDFENLPVEVYIKGYIREYAKILNIDPEGVLEKYVQQTSPPEKIELPPIQVVQSKRPKRCYLVIASVLSAAASVLIIFHLFVPKNPSLPPEPQKETPTEATNIPHILEVIAIDTTWVSVTTDGKKTKEVLLQPGESFRVDAQSRFSLLVGNAGGIRVILDGKELSPLGARGQVMRVTIPSSETTQ